MVTHTQGVYVYNTLAFKVNERITVWDVNGREVIVYCERPEYPDKHL